MTDTEHDAFSRLTDALILASSAARAVGRFRPDQQAQWDAVAAALAVTREACFRLAGEGTVGRH